MLDSGAEGPGFFLKPNSTAVIRSHRAPCSRFPKQVSLQLSSEQSVGDVARAMVSAGIPCTKEPLGLSRSDGKRPDGLSLVPWEAGKPLTWDVTVICPLADSYVAAAAREAGSAAEEAANSKSAKYSNIQAHHIFQPVAVESLGPISASGRVFLSILGRKLADQSGDDREISFLFQRLSVLIQLYNAILLHGCFVKEEEE